MSKFQASFPIDTQRYNTGGSTYDVTIYQRSDRYHAAWYCNRCLSRAETVEYPNQAAAKRAAEAEIGNHQINDHHGPEGKR